jgi:hypothetical protein
LLSQYTPVESTEIVWKRWVDNPVLFYPSLVVSSALVAMIALWLFSKLDRPIEYLVAGTFATVLILAGLWLTLVKRRLIR